MIGALLVAIIWGAAVVGSLSFWFFGVRACAASTRQQNGGSELLCGALKIVAITSVMALVYVDWPSSQRFPDAILWALFWLTIWPAAGPLSALYICIAYPLLFAPAMVAALSAAFVGLCIGTAKSQRLARCMAIRRHRRVCGGLPAGGRVSVAHAASLSGRSPKSGLYGRVAVLGRIAQCRKQPPAPCRGAQSRQEIRLELQQSGLLSRSGRRRILRPPARWSRGDFPKLFSEHVKVLSLKRRKSIAYSHHQSPASGDRLAHAR